MGHRQFSCICSESDIASKVSFGLKIWPAWLWRAVPGSKLPLHSVSSVSLVARRMAWVPFVCHVRVVLGNSLKTFKSIGQHGVLIAMSALWALPGRLHCRSYWEPRLREACGTETL